MPAATFIDAIPNHISVEEHRTLTGSTPTSFSDIPPVLRQKVDNVLVAFDPPLDGFSPEDGALCTLYIIERFFLLQHPPTLLFMWFVPLTTSKRFLVPCSVLAFQSSTGRAFQIEYPSITLHATSRGDSDPFVYCQLDESPAADAAPSDGDEDGTLSMRELSLTPQDSGARAFRHLLFLLSYAKL